MDGQYSLVAGHVDPGETFTQCVIREAKEEAGINVKEQDLKVVHVMHRDSGQPVNNYRIDVFFIAESWQGKITNMEQHKCDDLSWHNIDHIPENTIPYIKTVIDNIRKKVFYDEHGWQ